MTYETLGLKENPFRLTPPLDQKEIIWAGMHEVKDNIEKRIKIAMRTQPSRIVLNWGSYGSGKTHASLYFSKTNRLEEISNELSVSLAKSIKITLPRSSNNIVQEFLRSFLGQYSLEEIYSDFKRLKTEFSEDKLIEMINAFSNDNSIADAFKKFIKLDLEDSEEFNKFKNYIYGDSTKSTLTYLGLPLGLTNDEQIANFLATIINCITYEKKLYSTFFIWLDEFEDIDTVKKSLADRFTTFLRQFIDKTPNNLILFLNFTQKAFMDIEDLSIYLGEALTSRAKAKIDFKNPTIEEAVEYVKELCEHYKKDDVSKNPFDNDETIKYALKHIGNLTARKINETFSIIFEMALLEGKDQITQDFIDSIKDEIIAWEE